MSTDFKRGKRNSLDLYEAWKAHVKMPRVSIKNTGVFEEKGDRILSQLSLAIENCEHSESLLDIVKDGDSFFLPQETIRKIYENLLVTEEKTPSLLRDYARHLAYHDTSHNAHNLSQEVVELLREARRIELCIPKGHPVPDFKPVSHEYVDENGKKRRTVYTSEISMYDEPVSDTQDAS